MGKKEELETTEKLVKRILIEYPMARSSDSYLYIRVVKALCPEALNKPFSEVMFNLKELGLPCFETVRRSRQKIQNENPILKANERCRITETEMKKYTKNIL